MGNFRQGGNSRGGFNRGSRFGGRSSGRFGGFDGGRGESRGRDFGGFERKRLEMHEVTCDKCGKKCEVPFKPSGDKPVFCSDCFRKEGDYGSGSRDNFDSRNKSSQAGISMEQMNQINKKLDKILEILQDLDIVEEDESDDELEDNSK